ncbi:uncharacterized protein LOC143265619 [Megachile rotundata]|uniref:uncharacterized protein LOC143265619 n=1 Tax=Megachile rotundata TaxID=143995 RepID=UPI003FD460EF
MSRPDPKNPWESLRPYRRLVDRLVREHPDFWTAILQAIHTPPSRDVAVQTVWPQMSNVGTQTEPPPPTADQATQTGEEKIIVPRARRWGEESPTSPQPSSSASRGTECWNCGATGHRYSSCPKPQEATYCYRCGRQGVSLRTCPTCAEEWKEEVPYHPTQRHLPQEAHGSSRRGKK